MLSSHLPANPNLESTQFSTLELPSFRIRIIDKINPSYCFISRLYLDHNNLITLNGIQQFQNLEVLSFNFNYVASLNEVAKIRNKFFMKEIAFIGNPMEGDVRARREVLVEMGFNGLERFNLIGETRIGNRFRKRDQQKIQTIHSQYEHEGKTQRYAMNFGKEQLQKSRKMTLKTEVFRDQTQMKHYYTRKQNTNANRSTTQDKSPQLNGSPHRKEVNVVIKPFQQRPEEPQSDSEIQFQSPIKPKDQSSSLFHQTGHFDDQSSELRLKKIEFKGERYKDFAMEFLEEQKIQIADAFRARHIKQKTIEVLRSLTLESSQQKSEMKRKAWAIMKMYNILNSSIQKTRVN